MKWISNTTKNLNDFSLIIKEWDREGIKWYIGPPKRTNHYSFLDIEKMGMIGIYANI